MKFVSTDHISIPAGGLALFSKASPVEINVPPQQKSHSRNLHFLKTAASRRLAKQNQRQSRSSATARAEKTEASELFTLHSILLYSRLTFQRSPLVGGGGVLAGVEAVRGGSFWLKTIQFCVPWAPLEKGNRVGLQSQ